MSDGSQGRPPPGWYTDASRADRLRWWDGAAWTEDFRPAMTDAAAAVEPVAGAPFTAAPTRRLRRVVSPAPATDTEPPPAESPPAEPPAAEPPPEGPNSSPSTRRSARSRPTTAEESSIAAEADASQTVTAAEPVASIEARRVEEVPHAAHVWPAPSSLAAAAAPGESPAVTPEAAVSASGSSAADVPLPAASSSARTRPTQPRRASTESIRDQIVPRRLPPPVDRPPAPIVYQPVASSSVGGMRPPLPEANPRNVPAIASIVLLALAAIGGLAVVLWLAGWNQTIAGLVSLVSIAFAAGAFFLAIGGLIVAGQRRTGRAMSAVALAVSVVLVAWLAFVATEQALAILA